MLNKVNLIGNLGADPECRFMPDGTAVTNFSLATSRSWKDKNSGERATDTEWHRIIMFRKLAEIASEYLKKGSKIHIEGRLKTRQWEKDGVKHYTTEIIAEQMIMLDGKKDDGQTQTSGKTTQSNQDKEPPVPNYADFDDDIPFNSLNSLIRSHLV